MCKLRVVAVIGLSLMLFSVPAGAQPSGEDFDVGGPIGDSVPHGPGTSINLCQFITQAEAEQLVGVALQPAQWSGPGWVNSCAFGALGSSSIAHAGLNVSDYGSSDQAAQIIAQNLLLADYFTFAATGYSGAVRTNALVTTVFVQKGQYMITVEAFAPESVPSSELMMDIAGRVVPAL